MQLSGVKNDLFFLSVDNNKHIERNNFRKYVSFLIVLLIHVYPVNRYKYGGQPNII